MAFVQYQTTVDWDSTLTDLGYTSDGYVESAVKTTTGAPTATAGKFITSAQILNKVSGITYTNTGTTASPVWSVLGGGGGGGMAIGDSVADADASSILYVDGTGNLTQDTGFTRDIATGNTNISATYSGNLFKQQINSNIESLGYEGSAMTFSDGSGNTGFRGLYIDTGKGDYVILDNLTLSDGTAVSNEINSGSGSITTYTYNGTSFLSGTSVIASDAINIYNDVGAGNELGFFVEAGTLLLGNRDGGNGTKITIDDTAQTINFNNNYSFPFADGTAGQVLGTGGS